MMDQWFGRGSFFILFSIYVCFIFQIIPMGEWLSYVRPDWVLLVVLFWGRVIPARFGLISVFVVGLLMDVVMDKALGLHAMSLLLVAYLQLLLQKQVRVFSTGQQILLAMFFSFIYLSAIRILNLFFDPEYQVNLSYWLPVIVNALLWPGFYMLMDGLRVRYSIYERN